MNVSLELGAQPQVGTSQDLWPSLTYECAEGWLPLPGWGTYFLQLGTSLARRTTSGHRLVLGLAVPTRAFAASLIGAGLVTAGAQIPSSLAQIEAHFTRLATLPLGTPLVYRRNGKQRLRAVFDGCSGDLPVQRIRIKVEAGRGGNCHLLDAKLAQFVQVAEGKSPHLPKQQHGTSVAQASEFATHFIGLDSAATFTSIPRLDCLIVGSATRLRAEIVDTAMAIVPTSILPHEPRHWPLEPIATRNLARGNLQILLRARRFLSSGESYRSDVLPGKSGSLPDQPDDVPRFVIFDGAASYLHGRDRWRHCHRVVVLDRVEREFGAAASAFDQDFMKFRADTPPTLDVSRIPAGVDMAMYEEAWP